MALLARGYIIDILRLISLGFLSPSVPQLLYFPLLLRSITETVTSFTLPTLPQVH